MIAMGQGQATEKIETRVETKPIPAQVRYEVSRTVGAGRIHKVSDGKPGEVRRVYQVVIRDGKPVSKKLVGETTVQPEAIVIEIGREGFASSRHSFGRGRVLTMRATAYDPSPATIGRHATGRTRTGRIADFGVAAVDPRVIPLNTMLYIEGYGLALACDTGGAIKGNRIDLCYKSKRVADRYGVHKVVVHVLR